MKYAIDVTEACIQKKTGCAHYTINAVEALRSLNTEHNHHDTYKFYCRASRWKKRAYAWVPSGYSQHWFQEPICPFRISADFVLGFGSRVPLWRQTAKGVILFDAFSTLDAGTNWNSKRFKNRKQNQYRLLAKYCDVIMTISTSTKNDFLKFIDYPEERIKVVYGGVQPNFCQEQTKNTKAVLHVYDIPDNFLFYAGAITARKNIVRLIHAYSISKTSKNNTLVLTGTKNNLPLDVLDEIKRSKISSKIQFIGYVSDKDLPVLYASAHAFLFPTLYEGLGLPILEAMSSGTPTVIGNVGAAPEIAQDFTVLVDPYDVQSIADGIDSAMIMDTNTIDNAIQHANSFSWQACAKKIREASVWATENRL